MKKSLLLAAFALLGLAPQASAMKQLTNDNCATEIQDGRLLLLQCIDNSGGLWYFWNGCQAKSATINPDNAFLQIEFCKNADGSLIQNNNGLQKFYLKDYKNPDKYLSGSGNLASWTTDKTAAAQWIASVSTTNVNTDYVRPSYIKNYQNTVRFDKGGSYLNCNNTNNTPKYFDGKGGLSYWFAYVFDTDEVTGMTTETAPKMVNCTYTWESELFPGQVFDGMNFAALEGTDMSTSHFNQAYASDTDNFASLTYAPGQDMIVSEENNTFHLIASASASWQATLDTFDEDYKNIYSKVHRATIKPTGAEHYISFSYLIDGLRPDNTHKLFGASHMWYLEHVGIDANGNPTVKMMSVQKYGQGLTVNPSDLDHAYVTENPTVFTFERSTVANSQDTDFVLYITDPETGKMYVLNDRVQEWPQGSKQNVHFLATWERSNRSQCQSGVGNQIRFLDIEDQEFDDFKVEVRACGYPEYLATHQNGVDISDEAIELAKTTRLPENVTKIFPENVALLQGLRTYLDYTGLAFYENRRINGFNGEEDFYGIPGWVQDGAVVDLYNALDNFDVTNEATWRPVAEARWALVDAQTQPSVSYDITPGAIFNMVNFDNDRGYLVNDEGVLRCSVAKNHARTFDPESDDFKFTFVKVGDNLYMYNLGAQKFMNAFGEKSDKNGPIAMAVTDHTWRLSDVPTIIRGAFPHNGGEHTFSIAGGMVTGTDDGNRFGELGHEGGIAMLDDCERGVLVTLGNDGRADGSGLIADFVGHVEAAEYDAIVKKAEEAIAAIPTTPHDWSEIEGIVNHLTQEANEGIATIAANEALGAGGHDHIHYHIENADRQGFEADKVYNFFVDANNALKVNPNTESLEVAEFDGSTSFNLVVTPAAAAADLYYDGPESTTYNFMHTITNDGNDKTVAIAYNGTTDHAIDMSELGKVKLGDETLIAKEGTGAATTGIAEITTATGSMNVYDLQGRKLAAPTRGINIINGQKTLVK